MDIFKNKNQIGFHQFLAGLNPFAQEMDDNRPIGRAWRQIRVSYCREAFRRFLETSRVMLRVIMQRHVRILNICLCFRLLRLLVPPVFCLYNSARGWGVPLFTPAGLFWSLPCYIHSAEGVYTPTLWHRGNNGPRLHPPAASYPPEKLPVDQIPFSCLQKATSDSVAVVSKVSPVYCGPLFRLICLAECWHWLMRPVNPTPPRQVFTARLKLFALSRYWLWQRLCLRRARSATTVHTPSSAGLARGAKYQEKWRKERVLLP